VGRKSTRALPVCTSNKQHNTQQAKAPQCAAAARAGIPSADNTLPVCNADFRNAEMIKKRHNAFHEQN
jgi:hypothetical protein